MKLPSRYRLQSRRLVLGAGSDLRLTKGWIEVDGPKIVDVFETGGDTPTELPPDPNATTVPTIDVGYQLVTPAFVNAHTHLVLSFLRSVGQPGLTGNLVEEFFFTVESQLTAGDVRAFARMGAYESLLSGVGFVWDHYYFGREVAEAMREVGLAGAVGPTLQDVAGPGVKRLESEVDATFSIDEDATLRRAGIVAVLAPHATDTVSDDLWKRVVSLAQAHDLPVHAHLAQSLEELQRAVDRWGVTPLGGLERLGVLDAGVPLALVHALFVSRADLDLAKRSGRVHLGFCPAAQLLFGFPADVGAWQEAGVPWFVATDCGAANDSMNLQKELRHVAGAAVLPATYGPPLQQFLASGTPSDAAAVWEARNRLVTDRGALRAPTSLLDRVWSVPGSMHPKVRCGVLEAGAAAHIAVWDTDHPTMWPAADPLRVLAYGDTTSALSKLVVAGRMIDEPASLARSDAYVAARQEASDRLQLLLARI